MATALTKTALPGYYSQTGVALTMAAGDVTGNTIVATRKQLIIARNSGAGERTITIASVADPITGRIGDVTTQAIAAGAYRIFQVGVAGWASTSTGLITVTPSHAEVILGVVDLE